MGVRILLVEDEAEMSDFIVRGLERRRLHGQPRGRMATLPWRLSALEFLGLVLVGLVGFRGKTA